MTNGNTVRVIRSLFGQNPKQDGGFWTQAERKITNNVPTRFQGMAIAETVIPLFIRAGETPG